MKRIDEETREAIAQVAQEIEDEGFEVNRRGLAREFGVSPQTVARILDGPAARRLTATSKEGAGKKGHLGALVIAGTVAILAWLISKSR